MLKRSGQIILLISILYSFVNCKVTTKERTVFEAKVNGLSNIIDAIFENYLHPLCSLVVASENTQIPLNMKPLTKQHENHKATGVSQIKPVVVEIDVRNVTVDPLTQYIPWPVNESNAASVGTCVLFVVIVENDVDGVLLELSKYYAILPQRHHFVLWYTGEDYEKFNKTLLSDKTSLLKYKLSAMPGLEKHVDLKSVCFFCDKGEPEVTTMGTMLNKEIVTWRYDKPYIDFTKKLNGKSIKSVFLHESSEEIIKKVHDDGEVLELGHTLMRELGRTMDFTWHQYEIDIGEAAAVEMQLEDGKWLGFIGDVMSGKAYFCPGSLMTYKAYKYISYTEVTVIDYFTYVTALPKPLFTWKTVFQPYDSIMWLLTGVSILLSSVFLVTLMNVKWQKSTTFETGKQPDSLWLYTLPFLILAILGWGSNNYPQSNSTRVFIILWLLFALVLSCAYQCKLVAFMTFPAKEIIPETYYDLEQSDYEYGGDFKETLFMQMILEEDELAYVQRLSRNLIRFPDLPTCMKKSLNKRLACLSLRLFLYYKGLKDLDEDGNMLYKIAPDAKFNIVGAAMLTKNSITLDTFSRVIQGIRENGMFDFLEVQSFDQAFRIGLKSEDRGQHKALSGTKAMTIHQLQGAMFCLGVGFAAAITAFVSEISGSKVKKRNARKK